MIYQKKKKGYPESHMPLLVMINKSVLITSSVFQSSHSHTATWCLYPPSTTHVPAPSHWVSRLPHRYPECTFLTAVTLNETFSRAPLPSQKRLCRGHIMADVVGSTLGLPSHSGWPVYMITPRPTPNPSRTEWLKCKDRQDSLWTLFSSVNIP